MVVLQWLPLVSAGSVMVTAMRLGAQDRATLAVAAVGDSERDGELSAIDLDERNVWLVRTSPDDGRGSPEVLRVPVTEDGRVGTPQAVMQGPPSAEALTCVAKSLLERSQDQGSELARVLSADMGPGMFPNSGGCDAVLAMSAGLSPEFVTLRVNGEGLSQLDEWSDACDASLSRVLGNDAMHGVRTKHGCRSTNATDRVALREMVISFASGNDGSALQKKRLRLIRAVDAGSAGTFTVGDRSWEWPPRAPVLSGLAARGPLLV